MKKYIALLLALLLCFALCACGEPEPTDSQPADPIKPTESTESIDPDTCDHELGEWVIVEEATCTTPGLKYSRCACGRHSAGQSYIGEHTWVDATCLAPKTCTTCGRTEGWNGDHQYAETGRVEATKTTNGDVTYTCDVCGDSYKEVLHATGSEGLAYENNSDGTLTVVGLGTCTDSQVVIPAYVDGMKVTAIGRRAFYDCTTITEITIPETIGEIGAQIFYKCSSLHTVYYNSAYSNTDNPFLNVANIKKVVFGGKVVPNSICYDLQNIEEVIILDGVTSIGYDAFSGCSSLTSIAIPDSVTRISSFAFRNCEGLASVYISSVSAWCQIQMSDMYSNPFCYAVDLFVNNVSVTELEIPAGVTSIGNYTFLGFSMITRITIPNSVTSIGGSAFSGCSSLTSIVIPDSVTSIGGSAFSGCSSLTSIVIPDSVTGIGGSAFSGCSSLTSITIPDSVTSIGDYAFQGCTGLTSITIPDSVNGIGGSAFFGCSSLTSIVIPNSVTNIGYCAFYNCSSLTSITIPDSVTSIGDYAFRGCTGLTSITIPDNVTSIGYCAFYNCSSLTSITIPDSVTSIGISAFEYCRSLTDIRFGGTKEQWNAIPKGSWWNSYTGNYTIYCTDGEISK